METDAPRASVDQLTAVRERLAEFRDLNIANEDLEAQIEKNKERLQALRDRELVELFDTAKITSLTLEAVGNYPAFTVEIGDYYHANIAADWEPERREKAFAWFRREGHDDVLRNTVIVSFGKKTAKAQRALVAFLRKNKMVYTNEYGIPWNTLTAFVKEQIETYKRTPPLELLGATVGRVAMIKKPKKEK
jgi:hypothetical protein